MFSALHPKTGHRSMQSACPKRATRLAKFAYGHSQPTAAKKETISALAEKPNNRFDPEACCRPEIDGSDSFEARWRALKTTLVKN
jgi:hypothetical protein